MSKLKEWKLNMIEKFAQKYADLIVRQIEQSIKDGSEWQFNYWMNQGIALDNKMIYQYEIYLN